MLRNMHNDQRQIKVALGHSRGRSTSLKPYLLRPFHANKMSGEE
jgi:hypothetical protein